MQPPRPVCYEPTPTCGPLPDVRRLNHRADNARHRKEPPSGGLSPSQVIRDLRPAAHVARGARPLVPRPYVPGSRPDAVTASPHAGLPARGRAGHFRGPNTEASLLPTGHGLFAVRHRLRQGSLASPRGPLVVELFAVGRLARSPGLSSPGPACRQVGSSPRQPRLNGPGSRPSRNSWRLSPWAGFAPALSHGGPAVKHHLGACPCRPCPESGQGRLSDRTLGFLRRSSRSALLQRASVELDERLSTQSSSTGPTPAVAGGWPASLPRLVRPKLVGAASPRSRVTE